MRLSLFSQFSLSSRRLQFSNLEFIRDGQPLLQTCRPYSTLVGQCSRLIQVIFRDNFNNDYNTTKLSSTQLGTTQPQLVF